MAVGDLERRVGPVGIVPVARRISSRTFAYGSARPRASSSAWRRRARSSSHAVRKNLYGVSGKTFEPISRPSMTAPLFAADLSLAGDEKPAHAGNRRNGGGVKRDLGLADRERNVVAVEPDGRSRRSGRQVDA